MYTYLIVDDEMIERKGIRMLLSRMNIRENILEASNGEEALEVFEKEKIDVLLTDIICRSWMELSFFPGFMRRIRGRKR
jgi:two-component system response regulator YesN